MLHEYLHTNSESLAEIRATTAETELFSSALFLLAHTVHLKYKIISIVLWRYQL